MKFLLIFTLLTASVAFSLSLKEAKLLALKNHIEAIKGNLDLKKLEEKVKEIRAKILPTLNFSATYIRWDKNYISAFVPPDKYSASLSLNQPIFNRAVWTALKLAQANKELQKLFLEEVKVSLLAEVEKLFWAVLLRREIFKEKRESLSYWKKYFNFVEEKYKKGIIPKYEFLRAKAQLRQAEADLIKAEAELKVSLNSLKSFLGLKKNIHPEGEFGLAYIQLENPLRVLEKNNLTLQILRKTIRVKQLSAEVQKSEFFPQVSFFLNYNWENIMDFKQGRLKEDFRHGYNLGLKVDIPVYEGGARIAKVMQEKIEKKKAERELDFVKVKLSNELKSLLLRLKSVKEEIKARKESLIAAEESLRFATERYISGVGNQVELLDARKNYENSKILYLESVFNYNVIVADLKKLLGLGLFP